MTHYSSNKWKVNSLAIKCTLVKLHALWCCAAKVLIALVVIHVSSESQVGEDVAHRTPRPKDVCCFPCLWSHSTEVTFNPPDTLWLTVFLIVNWDFWHIWVISLVRRQVWCCMTTIFMSVKERNKWFRLLSCSFWSDCCPKNYENYTNTPSVTCSYFNEQEHCSLFWVITETTIRRPNLDELFLFLK